MDLLKKIEEAKAKFGNTKEPSVKVAIAQWESDAKKLLLVNSLRGNAGLEFVLKSLRSDIDSMNLVLIADRTLKDEERLRLLDRKDLYIGFIKIFDDTENNLARIEKMVDENIVD